MLVYHKGTQSCSMYTGLYKFVQNISTNIWSLEKRTDFKLEAVTSLLISHNNTISWLYLPNGFQLFFCFVTVQAKNKEIPKFLLQYIKTKASNLVGALDRVGQCLESRRDCHENLNVFLQSVLERNTEIQVDKLNRFPQVAVNKHFVNLWHNKGI